jgi:hypothetical protein
MGIRDDRAAAIRRRLRDLGDDHARAMPLLLDDLDAIDRQAMASWRFKVGGTIYEAADVAIYDAQPAPGVIVSFDGELTGGQVADLGEKLAEAVRPKPARPAPRRRAAK